MIDISSPRSSGRDAVERSVPAAIWRQNFAFRTQLLAFIQAHRIMRHPIIEQLDAGTHDLAAQQLFHLEFRHAFAQIFTDGLIRAMCTSSQLEPRLGAIGKVSARFLLQLNVLDELGFQPVSTDGGDYAGNPHLAHYVQFDETLRQLGISAVQANAYVPSAAAAACRATFESNYDDHVSLVTVLAVSETVFTRFCGPWAKSVGAKAGIDVSDGYHSIHVEKDGEFIDDDHSEDAWYVFQQAIEPDQHEQMLAKVAQWLDTWCDFLDQLGLAGEQR
jgi:hypothetical protein